LFPYHTGVVARGAPHPILKFQEAGVPVAVCCDNTTISHTDQVRESLRAAGLIGADAEEAIHHTADTYTFIHPAARLKSESAD
jgi:adenosine deaminase